MFHFHNACSIFTFLKQIRRNHFPPRPRHRKKHTRSYASSTADGKHGPVDGRCNQLNNSLDIMKTSYIASKSSKRLCTSANNYNSIKQYPNSERCSQMSDSGGAFVENRNKRKKCPICNSPVTVFFFDRLMIQTNSVIRHAFCQCRI